MNLLNLRCCFRLAALSCVAMAAIGASPDAVSGSIAGPDGSARQVTLTTVIRLKPDAAAAFSETMRGNARHSRGEPGAISFDVFRPEDGSPVLVLFERWHDQAALDAHMQQPTLKAVLAAIPDAVSESPRDLRLTEVPPYGARSRRPPAVPSTSRNIVVHLAVKPEHEAAFLAAWADVIAQARKAPGNAVFELYRRDDQPQAYVLFERWDSVLAHEAHLAQPYSQKLDAVLPETLALPIRDGESRFVLADIVD